MRLDEFEARLREAGYFRSKGQLAEAAKVMKDAVEHRTDQIFELEWVLSNYDTAEFLAPSYVNGIGIVDLKFKELTICIPIPEQSFTKSGLDHQSYARKVLEERLRVLKSYESNPSFKKALDQP